MCKWISHVKQNNRIHFFLVWVNSIYFPLLFLLILIFFCYINSRWLTDKGNLYCPDPGRKWTNFSSNDSQFQDDQDLSQKENHPKSFWLPFERINQFHCTIKPLSVRVCMSESWGTKGGFLHGTWTSWRNGSLYLKIVGHDLNTPL